MTIITSLIDAAASLMEGGDPVALDKDGYPVNHEYLRGQAELIIGAYGMDSDDLPTIVERILDRAGLEVLDDVPTGNPMSDNQALNALHSHVNGRDVSGADLTELTCQVLAATGRPVADPADL